MIFYSPDFLLFLPVVLVICFLVPKRVQNIWLLIASLLFYASGGIQYLPFLLLSVTVSYFCALACEKYPDKKRIALLIWVFVYHEIPALCLFLAVTFSGSSGNLGRNAPVQYVSANRNLLLYIFYHRLFDGCLQGEDQGGKKLHRLWVVCNLLSLCSVRAY